MRMSRDKGSASVALLDALHVLMINGHIGSEERLSVRKTSRGFRDVHDRSLTSLSFGKLSSDMESEDWRLPSKGELAAFVKSAASRGCRPLELSVGNINSCMDTAAAEDSLLALLSGFAPACSVVGLHLGPGAPVTNDVANAIAGLSPRLERLAIFNFNSESFALLTRQVGSRLTQLSITTLRCAHIAAVSYCTALTELKLRYAAPPGTPDHSVWAAELAAVEAIASLINLQHLDLQLEGDQPSDMRRREGRAGALLQPLSSLTALTRLDVQVPYLNHAPRRNGPDLFDTMQEIVKRGEVEQMFQLYNVAYGEWLALAALVRQLPRLRSLRTCAHAVLSDLRALTTLTSLRVGDLALPRPPQGGGAAACDGAAVSYSLPPLLQRLETNAPVAVEVVAALQAPPKRQPLPADTLQPTPSAPLSEPKPGSNAAPPSSSSTSSCSLLLGGRLCSRSATPWCLYFSSMHIQRADQLRPSAAAVMRSAAEALASFGFPADEGRSGVPIRGMRVSVGPRLHGYPLRPPDEEVQEEVAVAAGGGTGAVAGLGNGHCTSWLSALVVAARPRHLELCSLCLSPRDMLGMARCLQGVEVLQLEACEYAVASLPLLASLAPLRELYLEMSNWYDCTNENPGLQEEEVVQSAFLALAARVEGGSRGGGAPDGGGGGAAPDVLPLRGLRLLEVRCSPNGIADWLEEVLWPVREELVRLGGADAMPELRVVTPLAW